MTDLPTRLRASAQEMRKLPRIDDGWAREVNSPVALRIARELEEAAGALEVQQKGTAGVETAAQLNTDGVPEIVPEVAFRTKGDAATSGAGALMANAAPLAGSNPAAIHPHGVAEFMAGLDTAPKGRGFTGQRPSGVPAKWSPCDGCTTRPACAHMAACIEEPRHG